MKRLAIKASWAVSNGRAKVSDDNAKCQRFSICAGNAKVTSFADRFCAVGSDANAKREEPGTASDAVDA